MQTSRRSTKEELVVSIVTVALDPAHSPTIVGDIIEALQNEYGDLAGFVRSDVLVSTDLQTLAILTEWRDIHHWSASRYDPCVGRVLEGCLLNSTALSFELYFRRAQFVRRPEALTFIPRIVETR
jgi:hypothetical protein